MGSTSHHGLVNQPTLEEFAAEYVTTFQKLKAKGTSLTFGETLHICQEMHRRFGIDRTNAAIKQMFELNKLLGG